MLAASDTPHRHPNPPRAHRRAGGRNLTRRAKPRSRAVCTRTTTHRRDETRCKRRELYEVVLVSTDYTFGSDEISQRVHGEKANGTPVDETLVFGHDGHGSVRVLYDLAATGANLIEQVFTFAAYGSMLAVHNATGALVGTNESIAKTTLGYSGEHFDAKAQQQYLRARLYNPANGQFNRLDPFTGNMQDPQSLHKYAYVHGDPILGIDPTGEFLAITAFFTAIDVWSVHIEAVTAGFEAHNAGVDGLEGYKYGLAISAGTAIATGFVIYFFSGPIGRVLVRIDRLTKGYWRKYFQNISKQLGGRFRANDNFANGKSFLRTKPQHPDVPSYPKDPNSKPISTSTEPGSYVFVQDSDGVVHVLPNGPHLHPKVLGNRQEAAASGELTIDPNGTITEINNISYTFQHDGSELPTVQKTLETLGLRVDPDAIKVYEF